MKVTVDIPDSELKEICFFTGEKKKGPDDDFQKISTISNLQVKLLQRPSP